MGARQKLNSTYFTSSLIVAGLVGAVSGSWLAFGIGMMLLVGGHIACRNIRFTGRK